MAKRYSKDTRRTHSSEGFRAFPYLCSNDVLTIGIGFNIDEKKGGGGLSLEECLVILDMRMAKIEVELAERLGCTYKHLDVVRQGVLDEMAYQLGVDGLIAFKKTMTFITLGDYPNAAEEMLDSKWAKYDSPGRAAELSEIFETGTTP